MIMVMIIKGDKVWSEGNYPHLTEVRISHLIRDIDVIVLALLPLDVPDLLAMLPGHLKHSVLVGESLEEIRAYF